MGKYTIAMDWTTEYLNNMPCGTQVRVRDVPVKDKELLIECVKLYIDWYRGVVFSDDYSRIIKE